MIGRIVKVIVDRPIGSVHPKHKDHIYPLNYGYVYGILAGDGEEQDAYIIGINYPLNVFIGEIIATYNNRGKGNLDGTEYDFSACTGHIDYVMCGHAHKDYIETIGGIPCIITTKLKDSSTPTFDLCLADYDNNKLHLIRVGSGEDRTIDI